MDNSNDWIFIFSEEYMMIDKILGVIRFHIGQMLKHHSVSYKGLKQYRGKNSRIITSKKGTISIEKKLYLSTNSSIEAYNGGKIIIGSNNFFNSNNHIVSFEKIQIGNNNLFAQNVVIVDHSHCYDDIEIPICKQGYKCKPVNIGSDCWICANVVICPGTEIGDHIVVAANSVVKGVLIQPGVYAGCPAKLIKKRN